MRTLARQEEQEGNSCMNVFHAALARDFWITGIAIARYMPRAFRVKHVDGNQFFTEEKRQEYRRRVENVTAEALSPTIHCWVPITDLSTN
jgi:hypothetical protein